MKSEFSSRMPSRERARRITEVVQEIAARLISGEAVSDVDVIKSHPDLLPELEEQLRTLRRVETGRRAAEADPAASPNFDDAEGDGSLHESDVPSLSIPGYTILGELHRGGQGVVYRAIQTSTNRNVAIKVMKEGPFAGRVDRARFDREVQILGALNHPHIVTIHDSGVAAGCLYFVMNYISGAPLDEYIQRAKLSIEETLRLFAVICRAVNAAHLRGILHRDLKPSNIRVDPEGQPYILDFGLARSADESDASMMTITGQFVGSLPWASPEQAEGIPGRIDIRTDVYSLGVILYYLLTGRFPYEVSGSIRDVLDNILRADPTKPGTLRREIDEEAETIVLKCLAKEADRRYQSAGALAEDIDRYLTDQPILARAPSTVYQFKKLIVRHKLPAALVIALFVLMTGFTIGMSILYSRAMFAEQEALREARTAEAVNDYLIRGMLGSASHRFTQQHVPTVQELLANAAARVDTALDDKPVIKAAVLATIGNTYLNLGFNHIAEKHLRGAVKIYTRELNHQHLKTLQTRLALTRSLLLQGKRSEGMQLAAETLELARDALGEDHETTLLAADRLAFALAGEGKIDEATTLYNRTHQRRCRVMGEDATATLHSMDKWSVALWGAGRTTEAERYTRFVLDLLQRKFGWEDPWTLDATTRLGRLLMDRGQLSEAEEVLAETYEMRRGTFGDEDMKTLEAAMALALLFRQQERIDDSIILFQRIENDIQRAYGDDHPKRQEAMQYRGSGLWRKQDYGKALAVHRELLDLRRKMYGEQDGHTALSMTSISSALYGLGRYEEAETHLRQALDIQRSIGSNVSWQLRWLTKALVAQGKVDEARPFAKELLAFRKEVADRPEADADQLGMYARELLKIEPVDLRDPHLALGVALKALELSSGANHSVRRLLAVAYHETGNSAKAIEIIKDVLDACPLDASLTRERCESDAVRFLEESGQPEAAEEVYRKTLAKRRERYAESHPDIARSLENLGTILMRHNKPEDAETVLRECLTIRESALSPNHRLIGWTNTLLGASLKDQARFEESEPLLLRGYDHLRDDINVPLNKQQAALVHIVELYEKWGKEDKAAEYRARLQSSGTTPSLSPS